MQLALEGLPVLELAVPAGQAVQLVEDGWAENLPGSQGLQVVEPDMLL